ncbi:MAG: hypothetical protein ABR577_19470, partial [Pyrinomonadaceae bacterium]
AFHPSGLTPTYPLLVDTSLQNSNATISNVVISSASSPGIKTDRAIYQEPPLPALPAAGGKFTDPVFGTQIMRVTDQNDGAINGTFYSYWPTFNCNNTRILVKRSNGDAVYNFDPITFTLGTTRQVLSTTFTAEGAIWSSNDPNILYSVSSGSSLAAKLWKFDASTGTYISIRDFTADVPAGDFFFQMSKSEDNDVFAWTRYHRDPNGLHNTKVGYMVYRVSTNSILLNQTLSTIDDLDEVQIDKSGRWLLVKGEASLAANISNYIRDGQNSWSRNGLVKGDPDRAPIGHSDNGTGYNIGFEVDGSSGADYGYVRRNFSSPHSSLVTVLDLRPDYSQSSHNSLLATNESWMLVETYAGASVGDGLFHRELFQVKTDGSGSVRRFCHHRSIYGLNNTDAYWDQPRANISRDGQFVAFTSNWSTANGRRDMFIVKIPPASSTGITWVNQANVTATSN